MCGIGGVFLKGGGEVRPEMLRALAAALRHRGPDGEGVFSEKNVALVHRRLSIIDVAGGAQPISDRDNRVHIIGNGEIYNYLSVRSELEGDGVAFKTKSDTESALHLYKKHGLDFVRHLRGMYALALYDSQRSTLVLARDPFGIKPLYYAQIARGIAFASEPAALVKAGWVGARVEPSVLGQYFSHQFVAGRKTLFKGIFRVLPGEVLVIENGAIESTRRYSPDLRGASEATGAPTGRFDSLFEDAVGCHLQSEVPYGAFLSGGIDSSSMVLKMAAIAGPIRTFTIGFDSDTVRDEREDARILAETLGTEHRGVLFTKNDFWTYLPTMCRVMDDLAADYAALPLLKLSEAASRIVKVILCGEGGDEIFAGYGRYRRGWWDRLRNRPYRGAGAMKGFEDLFTFDPAHGETGALDRGRTTPDREAGFTALQSYQALDISDWLPDDLLLKVDRCLMAYGIEGRVPYLDKNLAAFGFALPDRYKVRRRHGKWLVKHWLSGQRPQMDVWRKKRGFTVPIRDWMEEKRSEVAAYLLSHDGIKEITHRGALEDFLTQSLSKRGAKLAFTLLCYALWHDAHIQGIPPGLKVSPRDEVPAAQEPDLGSRVSV